MASTSQSALEYIRRARGHLVGRLQSLSVIVENLHQQGVLNEEEVSKIQTETDDFDKTRKILDWVINKGEDACYELLKIIDMTRKRTLERPPPLPGKPGLASTQSSESDLHYWISCFPFREDTEVDVTYLKGPKPCHKYQAKLKSKAQKISDGSWIQSKAVLLNNTNPNLSYTSLVLDTQGNIAPSKIKSAKSKKSKKIRSKKLRTYIPEEKKGISPSDLLKTDEKNILLVGKPGIGKTAVTHQMLKLWAERDNKELDYMFYFDMRATSHITSTMSLEDLLFSVFREPDEGKEEVLQDIKKNSENVLIIFDGVTDLSSLPVVQGLVEKDLLPDAKIVMTCRPEVESEDFLLDWASLRVEVKGFSQQSIKAYLSEMLSTEHLSSILNNLELFTLCHVPMYALMVVACFSFKTSKDSQQPCTVTEIYINILRFCVQINNGKTKNKHLNRYISNKCEAILSLAEVAFRATQAKSVNLEEDRCEDSCVHFGFLKTLEVRVGPTDRKTSSAFLHYTMQEFFAGLWLLKNPEEFPGVVQQCLTEGTKHMKHLVPFICGLLNDKNLDMLKCLIPAEQVKETSNWLFKEVVNKFVPCLLNQDHSDTEGSGLDINILFLCQCLYESQSTEACLYLLDKLDYCLDLSEESLDPYHCCAVSYVISQSKERKIRLNLEDVMISEQGLKLISGCLKNVQWCDSLQQPLWTVLLLSEGEMDYSSFLGLGGNELHLPVFGKRQLFERAVKVMQESTERVILCLHWDRRTPVCPALSESLLESVPYIDTLSFRNTCTVAGSQDQEQHPGTLEMEEKKLLLDVCLKAALYKRESFHNVVNTLFSLFSVHTERYDFLLDLHQHIKSQGYTSVIPLLKPLYQSAAAVWSIRLSERKASLLLEVLKLQSEKKPVKLTGCSDEESEVWSFLQCLPHISQLSFCRLSLKPVEGAKFLGNLFCRAAEREQQTGEKILELLSSVCSYNSFPLNDMDIDDDDDDDDDVDKKDYQCDFLLDLCSHVKNYETLTGRSVLPALQSVYQSAPAVWSIRLSERKASLLLEVLKLQSGKKPVKLTGWSDEESEVWSFLQCLPHISQLRFTVPQNQTGSLVEGRKKETFLMNLCLQAALHERTTIQSAIAKVFSLSKCWHQKWDFLLDLYSHVKDYETLTGRSVLPALQSVYQSAAAVWSIRLSERKASLLLEVLKLQSEKKPVKLTGWSDEESEVWSFLQCLPHISQLRFTVPQNQTGSLVEGRKKETFLMNLCLQAALHERTTIQSAIEEVFSLSKCWHQKWDFLLDLYSHVKDYETRTGRSVLPALQSVYQSAAAVWSIRLSERKASLLLEVLKLQSGKKPVKLTGCSDEESEVWSFLQCLPHISQLSFCHLSLKPVEGAKFLGNLFCRAAEREQQTGEKILELLSSVCSYNTFPLNDMVDIDDDKYQCDFLLDLCSRVKDYETLTGRSVLPALQSVYQSAPAVWSIRLSERKASLLLEVLKLQSGKKPVELRGWSDEESEVWSFLQCLPHISQLSFHRWSLKPVEGAKFLGNLFCRAAEREQQTGEKILELLSSVCSYNTFPFNHPAYVSKEYQCDFLLDLYSHVKDYETLTGRSVLPALQSVYQSAAAVWSINLSKRKASLLLEVLKLQSGKKPVKLTGCSDEESEVWSFLQCLPHISQLSFCRLSLKPVEGAKFLGNFFCRAAEREQQTGEKILELLASVCSYNSFPLNDPAYVSDEYQWDFLLDLYSYVKDYETLTGRSVLPALQSVYQSAAAVWSIRLSERKASLLLEVLKLQSEKKPVELTGWSDEESEVWSFLQCLPHISQLSFHRWSLKPVEGAKFLGNLFCRAAEREQQTGEKILELLSSVCSYNTFPRNDPAYVSDDDYQCDFLLDLYSHVKDYETLTGRSVLPALQSVYQSAPAVWSIRLSERKASLLLEVLKLQSGKKPVKLTGCSDEESEVWSFLQCLPHISQLSFYRRSLKPVEGAKFLGNLFCRAAEREQQTGEKILELLSSVCSYNSFPLNDPVYVNNNKFQCDFLLDLYSHVKDYETLTGRSVLPALQSVYQSAPAVWSIRLSKRKASLLLEVLKLQSEKKPVKLTGWSDEESEVWSFLQCLPHISQLSCDPGFFQHVCESICVRSREETQQLASLLQLLGFTLVLTGELPRKTCRSVGRVLGLCGSSVDLILTPSKISLKGASLLFRHTSQIHSLRLSAVMALLLFRLVRTRRVAGPVAAEELSLVLKTSQLSDRVLLRVVSSVASLLRYWAVRCLDLTEFSIHAHFLMTLLLHHDPLTIKLCAQHFQQLLVLIHEIQDKDLTQSFLRKVGGDLTSCSLDWEVLHYLLQQPSTQTITVDLRRNRISETRIIDLLPFLDRILFKRPSPSLVLSAIRESYKTHTSHCIPCLLRSLDHVINLTCRQLDRADCAALLFTLQHSDGVKLKLLWTSIPTGGTESILFTLEKVSHLSLDRNLLLRFLHCCTASKAQQGAAAGLLRTLQHRLDLSCSSCVELSEQERGEALCLTAGDCRAISTVLRHSSQDTQLNLRDCEVEDSGLDLLFPVLDRVRLSSSKALLLQLVSLVPVGSERDTARRAESLCRALAGELDLSETRLDQRACGAVALILELSEGLKELDLSHCRLTDRLLQTLIPHLHKAQVLDLSHNKITDALTDSLLQLVSINTSIHTVRVFSNSIMDRTPFLKDKRFEMW
ncbi:uncharacterized protein LOC139932372 isoform X2 [Centroberyx gerrardi]